MRREAGGGRRGERAERRAERAGVCVWRNGRREYVENEGETSTKSGKQE